MLPRAPTSAVAVECGGSASGGIPRAVVYHELVVYHERYKRTDTGPGARATYGSACVQGSTLENVHTTGPTTQRTAALKRASARGSTVESRNVSDRPTEGLRTL